MGGLGSGKNYYRPRVKWRYNTKQRITWLLKLSISQLTKLQKETSGTYFVLDRFNLTVGESIILIEHKEGKELVTPEINLVKHPCNYGGFRYYATCPHCRKKVGSLYFLSEMFLCRCCLKLAYPSQNQTLSARLLLKADRFHKLLMGNEYVKPKWMRKRTFEKLKNKYFDLDDMAGLADLFSLRSMWSTKAIKEKYCAPECVPDDVLLACYGKNWRRALSWRLPWDDWEDDVSVH